MSKEDSTDSTSPKERKPVAFDINKTVVARELYGATLAVKEVVNDIDARVGRAQGLKLSHVVALSMGALVFAATHFWLKDYELVRTMCIAFGASTASALLTIVGSRGLARLQRWRRRRRRVRIEIDDLPEGSTNADAHVEHRALEEQRELEDFESDQQKLAQVSVKGRP